MSGSIEWYSRAMCVGQTDLFYVPPYSENANARRKREVAAIAICKTCPVMQECRTHGRNYGELGIWGGETEKERFLNSTPIVEITHRRPMKRNARKLLTK